MSFPLGSSTYGTVLMFSRQEIRSQHSSKFIHKWAQPQVRLNFLSVEDEVVAIRGMSAWTTAKEVRDTICFAPSDII